MTDSACTVFAKKWKSTREKVHEISNREMDGRLERTRDCANSSASAQFSRLRAAELSHEAESSMSRWASDHRPRHRVAARL